MTIKQIRNLAKRMGIKVTKKVNGKRVYKTINELKRNIRNKVRKVRNIRIRKIKKIGIRRYGFGEPQTPPFQSDGYIQYTGEWGISPVGTVIPDGTFNNSQVSIPIQISAESENMPIYPYVEPTSCKWDPRFS